jgi:hypothetical protein
VSSDGRPFLLLIANVAAVPFAAARAVLAMSLEDFARAPIQSSAVAVHRSLSDEKQV